MRSPGRIASAASRARGSRRPTPVVQTYILSAAPRSTTLVSPATISHAGGLGRARDRLDLGLQLVRGEALLEDQRQAQRERPRARHGEVVDRAVDRQVADRAAREADRLDDERVGGERQLDAVDLDRARVAHRARALRAERRHEQALDHALGGLAAGAVGHVDALVAELRALAARRLDDPEDLLLATRVAGRGAHTTSRSRAKRPKL